jgi:Glycosyl hydrolase family 9
VHGAVVGGPAKNDTYIDKRVEYKYSEIALDYNTLFTTAVAALAAAPATFWQTAEEACPKLIGQYPWGDALQKMHAFRAPGAPCRCFALFCVLRLGDAAPKGHRQWSEAFSAPSALSSALRCSSGHSARAPSV